MRVRNRVRHVGHFDTFNIGLTIRLGVALQLVNAILFAAILGGGTDDATRGEIGFNILFLLTGWVD